MVVNNSEKTSNAQIQSPKNLSKRRRQSNWPSRPSENFLNRRKGAGIPKGTTLDERIMNQSRTLNSDEEQNKAASDLKQEKNGGGKKEEKPQEKGTDRQIKARARKEAQKKKRQKQGPETNPGDLAKQGTAQLLKASWLNVIDSCGLTFIYINVHFFLSKLIFFDKVFGEVGGEWIPAKARKAAMNSPEMKSKMEVASFFEKKLILLIDAIIIIGSLASVFTIIFIIYIIIYVIVGVGK